MGGQPKDLGPAYRLLSTILSICDRDGQSLQPLLESLPRSEGWNTVCVFVCGGVEDLSQQDLRLVRGTAAAQFPICGTCWGPQPGGLTKTQVFVPHPGGLSVICFHSQLLCRMWVGVEDLAKGHAGRAWSWPFSIPQCGGLT